MSRDLWVSALLSNSGCSILPSHPACGACVTRSTVCSRIQDEKEFRSDLALLPWTQHSSIRSSIKLNQSEPLNLLPQLRLEAGKASENSPREVHVMRELALRRLRQSLLCRDSQSPFPRTGYLKHSHKNVVIKKHLPSVSFGGKA